MSGPKGVRYTVVSAAELERRALERATARLDRACQDREQLLAEVRTHRHYYGDQISTATLPQHRIGTGSTAVDATAARLEDALSRTRRRLATELAAARTAAMLAAAAPTRDAGQGASRVEAPSVSSPPSAAATPLGRSDRRQMVQELLASLNIDVPSAAAEEITKAAGQVLAEQAPGRAEMLLRALQNRVHEANQESTRERARQATLGALGERLLGVDGPTAQRLRDTVDTLVPKRGAAVPPGLAAEVAAAVDAARTLADSRFALSTAVECLAELGYEVSSGFDTLRAGNGVLFLRRASWPAHGVLLRADGAGAGNLGFNVVCDEDASTVSAARDREIEQEWCTDFGRLLDVAGERGLQLTRTRTRPPGTLAVQRVAGAHLGHPRRTQHEAGERSMGGELS